MFVVFFSCYVLFSIIVSFILWRRMRLDYKEERVLIASLILVVSVLMFGWLGIALGLSLWGAVVGLMIVPVGLARLWRWDGWDWFDAIVQLGYGYGLLYFLFAFDPLSLFLMFFGGIVVFVCHRKYRSWRWYKSGKLGISGFIGIGFFGAMQCGMLFGTLPGWIGAIVLAISVVAIGLRSRVSLRKS